MCVSTVQIFRVAQFFLPNEKTLNVNVDSIIDDSGKLAKYLLFQL